MSSGSSISPARAASFPTGFRWTVSTSGSGTTLAVATWWDSRNCRQPRIPWAISSARAFGAVFGRVQAVGLHQLGMGVLEGRPVGHLGAGPGGGEAAHDRVLALVAGAFDGVAVDGRHDHAPVADRGRDLGQVFFEDLGIVRVVVGAAVEDDHRLRRVVAFFEEFEDFVGVGAADRVHGQLHPGQVVRAGRDRSVPRGCRRRPARSARGGAALAGAASASASRALVAIAIAADLHCLGIRGFVQQREVGRPRLAFLRMRMGSPSSDPRFGSLLACLAAAALVASLASCGGDLAGDREDDDRATQSAAQRTRPRRGRRVGRKTAADLAPPAPAAGRAAGGRCQTPGRRLPRRDGHAAPQPRRSGSATNSTSPK